MKNIGYLIILSTCLFTGCQSDDNEVEEPQAQPTLFQGRVLYSDTNEPVTNTTLWVTASENELFAGDVIIESKSVMLSDNSQGEFNITFSSDPRIDYFSVEVNFFDEEVPDLIIGGSNIANGMVCDPIGCDDFVPGNEYTDLTILVPRPEAN
ncbi:MAG: hypothetical protein AAGC45_02570 [Bacteroidota bacterium]